MYDPFIDGSLSITVDPWPSESVMPVSRNSWRNSERVSNSVCVVNILKIPEACPGEKLVNVIYFTDLYGTLILSEKLFHCS